ncbi:MAG TPA: MXAN_5187 C-terminal domain-containing protein [Thermoanaerobaculia bacterium]|nr:MXAN_5187 C-terminal domain-containing protein [Thermoanaerobaculia bacterium]
MSPETFDRELRVLEEAIRRLNAEYDGFLYGSASKPPTTTRRHVEEMVRRLNASEDMSAAERYRFSTLQGRFTALNERWDRLQGEKEAGRRPGLYGHFREAGSEPPPPRPAPPNAAALASVKEERRLGSPGGSDQDLFDRYVAAKKARGEDVSGYRLEGFVEGLERERRKVRERLGEGDIEFDVAERDGRVRLVARRKRGAE